MKRNYSKLLCVLVFLSVCLFSCTPDNDGSLGTLPNASFDISRVEGKANTYALTSTSQNAFGYQWLKGTGDYMRGLANDTAYFPVKGTYTVWLRAFGRGGYDTASHTVTIEQDDLLNNEIFQKLIAHNWKLDGTPGAAAIIVGTDGNPAEYFAGGGLDNCQLDDIYTFSSGLMLTYNANGATFNAGNISPNYACGNDRSYSDVAFTFAPSVPAGAAGIASISISGQVPDRFIGVTDVSSNNYRIISISDTELVLRSGLPNETVHQFKFVVAD